MATHFRSEPKGFIRRPDGRWVVGYGLSIWRSERLPDQPCFYAPDFFLDGKKPWLCFEKNEVWSGEQWVRETAGSAPVKARFQSPEKNSFLRRTRELLESIETGRLEKAVPVEFAQAEMSTVSGEQFLSQLATTEKDLFSYGFWTGEEGMWGATPEILLSKTGLKIETMALAGTARIDGPNLLENPKEMHEHALVVADIENVLSPFGHVLVGPTSEKTLPRLKHLYTPITLELENEIDFEELIRLLHPTPALGGFPRQEAMAWLRAQPEASFRDRFGAPFGYVDQDAAFFVVAIRNVLFQMGKLLLGSGCGVVKGSDPEKEWLELALKRDTVRNLLGFA